MINTFHQAPIRDRIDMLFVSIGEKKRVLTTCGETERLNNLKGLFLKAKQIRRVSEAISSQVPIDNLYEQINQVEKLIEAL
jgi:hypothetical protein